MILHSVMCENWSLRITVGKPKMGKTGKVALTHFLCFSIFLIIVVSDETMWSPLVA